MNQVVESSSGVVSTGATAYQAECAESFAHAARALGLPKSVGQIYGLLFGSRLPLHLDAVVSGLGISKGSASQGLRWLREFGAVRTEYVAGDRRDHFVAETNLRRLATGYLRNTVEQNLVSGETHLERLRRVGTALENPEDRKFSQGRTQKLERWHKFGRQVLPLILKAAERF